MHQFIISKQLELQVVIIKSNTLLTVIGYQVFLSKQIICETDLFEHYMKP